VNTTELGATAWENVAVGATDAETPVAPALGVVVVTVGAGFGVTRFEADEAGPWPVAFVAETVNV
jgi:hypothetical protein